MSSFWTPSGEHEVPNGTDESSSTATSDNFTEEAEIDPAAAAAMEQQLREAQEQLLSVPASQIVANHIIGLFELAAIHLRVDPPPPPPPPPPQHPNANQDEQLGDQLPDHQTLAAALHQIRLAFVEVQNQTDDSED